ncbi:MAG: DctP family TRAP transporter solute-binding subunit [Sphaerochaeta associata]|uniref:DctP family TRAP transporter solute-binding subunit n=1 Tax=Sphaerochaeta associata TaxID=1129264 RepID=UPI002B221046|nr:DctP family TRAP transporter solute-binding subunit [Sphaerochaeta associata]MEA5028178.1 DctP family TRAP transporter solute-binding subunit [Sphaerochaeta associata]
MRKIALVVVLVVGMAMVFGGGQQEGKKLEFSASTGGMSASSPGGQGMAKFAEKVAEYSNGTIEIKVFYDTTLGSPSSMVSGMQQGTIDFGVCGDAYYSSLVPEIQVFELPYMFDSVAEARAAVAGPAGQAISEKLAKKGIQPLTFWEIGFRNLTNSKKAVNSPADLKGLKVRTLPATFQVKAWESAGAIPVPMDVSELYSALQQGVVDGQENPLSEIYNQRFHEVQKFMSLTAHVYTPMLFSAGGQTWARLTAEQQEIIKRAAKDAQAVVYSVNDTENANYLKNIKAAGVTVNENPDRQAFKSLMSGSQSLFSTPYGDEMLKLLNK